MLNRAKTLLKHSFCSQKKVLNPYYCDRLHPRVHRGNIFVPAELLITAAGSQHETGNDSHPCRREVLFIKLIGNRKKKWIELMKLNEGMIWWRCTSRCRPLRRRRPSITIRPSANRWVRHVRHVHVRHVHVPIWPMPLLDRYPTSSQTQPTKQNFICPPLTYSIA